MTNQLKILPTAGFSSMFLGRQLSATQWVSLPLLALGVAVVNASRRGVGGCNPHSGLSASKSNNPGPAPAQRRQREGGDEHCLV